MPAMIPRYRAYALIAAAVLTLFLLSQTFNVGSQQLETTTRNSLQVINNFAPSGWHSRPATVKKVTALFGQENELYEAAVRSHAEHDRNHGYELRVLRERIVSNYWSKPMYLLSLIVEELSKPVEDRTEWIMWLGPDIILLNPQIPLDIFLPPADFEDTNFIGTHDKEGFNGGAFFIRVSEWSVEMLVGVLALPKSDPKIDLGISKDQRALEKVLTDAKFRRAVVYQPRTWFNAYQLDVDTFEGAPGALLVHFHDLGGDKWSAMSHTITQMAQSNSTYSMSLAKTTYEREIEEFWSRMRKSQALLEKAERKLHEEHVKDAMDRLNYVRDYECDQERAMNSAMDHMKEVLGIKEGEKVV